MHDLSHQFGISSHLTVSQAWVVRKRLFWNAFLAFVPHRKALVLAQVLEMDYERYCNVVWRYCTCIFLCQIHNFLICMQHKHNRMELSEHLQILRCCYLKLINVSNCFTNLVFHCTWQSPCMSNSSASAQVHLSHSKWSMSEEFLHLPAMIPLNS